MSCDSQNVCFNASLSQHNVTIDNTLSNITVIATMRLDPYKYYTTLLYVVYNSGQVFLSDIFKTSMSNIYIYNLIITTYNRYS